jgi:WD40 repeat protein
MVKEWRDVALPKGATARLGSVTFFGDVRQCFTFSADGKSIYSPAGNHLFAWDTATGRELVPRTIEKAGESYAVAGDLLFALTHTERPMGQRARPGIVTVTELKTGKQTSQIPVTGPVLHFEGYSYPYRLPPLAPSPTGKYLAVVSEAERAVEVYAAHTGARLHTFGLGSTYPAGVWFSPDSKTLFVQDPGKPIRRFDPIGGTVLPDLAGTSASTNLVDASTDGKWAVTRDSAPIKDEAGRVTGVGDQPYLTVHDLSANKVVGRLEIGARPAYYRFAGPDSVIVGAMKTRTPGPWIQTVSRWNVVSKKTEWEIPVTNGARFVVSTDGRWLGVPTFGTFNVYDTTTGARTVTRTGHDGPVAWIGFSPDGNRVTTAGDTQIMTWSLQGDRLAASEPPELRAGWIQPALIGGERLTWVAFGPDGKTAELMAWDAEKRTIAWKMPLKQPLPDRVYSYDGKHVVGVEWHGERKVWVANRFDGPAGKVLTTWDIPDTLGDAKRGKYGYPWSPATTLSGDGTAFFVGGSGVVTIDTRTGKELNRVATGDLESIHGRLMHPIAASTDGMRLITMTAPESTNRFTVRVYDVPTGKVLFEHYVGEMYAPSARFFHDGKRFAVWNMQSNTIRLYDIESKSDPRLLEGSSRPTCVTFNTDGTKLVSGHDDGTAIVWNVATK